MMQNQVALVTGAGHGLGQAIALALAEVGCRVFGGDLSWDELQSTKDLVERRKGFFQPAVFDVCDAQAWNQWIETIKSRESRLEILVNNAGGVAGQTHQDVEFVDDRLWDKVIKINLYGAFYGIRAVAPLMKTQHYGRIINISSGAGRSHSLTGIQAYTSAKAGQIGLTRQMAAELGPFGITVNNVAPGFVRSNPATEKQWEAMGEEGQRKLVESIPVRRLGTPMDIAHMVRFLASPETGYVTGQVISVDGGHSMF